jgi:hypothetical protein
LVFGFCFSVFFLFGLHSACQMDTDLRFPPLLLPPHTICPLTPRAVAPALSAHCLQMVVRTPTRSTAGAEHRHQASLREARLILPNSFLLYWFSRSEIRFTFCDNCFVQSQCVPLVLYRHYGSTRTVINCFKFPATVRTLTCTLEYASRYCSKSVDVQFLGCLLSPPFSLPPCFRNNGVRILFVFCL